MEFAEVITKPRIDGVSFWRNNESPSLGSLVITGHHLLFESEDKPQTSFFSANLAKRNKCTETLHNCLESNPASGVHLDSQVKSVVRKVQGTELYLFSSNFTFKQFFAHLGVQTAFERSFVPVQMDR
uniref:GRAM domain-containing protein n=1 Tax=Romanomermis culicivorax TaxID=13658 RepID=A0A915I2Z4_ROMCU